MDYSYIDDFIQEMLDEEMNQSPEIMGKKMLFSQLMSEYLNQHGLDSSDDYSEYVPSDFEASSDYDTKIKILGDSLDKGILLEQSSFYPDILEGHLELEDDQTSK